MTVPASQGHCKNEGMYCGGTLRKMSDTLLMLLFILILFWSDKSALPNCWFVELKESTKTYQ